MCEDARFDVNRKDTFTYWALTVFVAMAAVYVELLTRGVPSVWRLGLLYITGALMIRFFIHSSLAYGGIKRWRHLSTVIEKHWFGESNSPTIDQVKEDIKKYDHDAKIPVGKTKLIWTQLRSGFILILGVTAILVGLEWYLFSSYVENLNRIITVAAGIYVLYEIVSFVEYGKTKRPPKKSSDDEFIV